MTREEFEEITSVYELIEFGISHDMYCTEKIYYSDSYNDCVADEIRERLSYDPWEYVRNYIDDLPSGYEYYISNDDGWQGIDQSDFDWLKGDIVDEISDNYFDYFDDEEDIESSVQSPSSLISEMTDYDEQECRTSADIICIDTIA